MLFSQGKGDLASLTNKLIAYLPNEIDFQVDFCLFLTCRLCFL